MIVAIDNDLADGGRWIDNEQRIAIRRHVDRQHVGRDVVGVVGGVGDGDAGDRGVDAGGRLAGLADADSG